MVVGGTVLVVVGGMVVVVLVVVVGVAEPHATTRTVTITAQV